MKNLDELEERIEILESSLAMQDRNVEEMNKFIIAQQGQIADLEKKITILAEQLKDITDMAATGNVEDAPPPHYN
ncbi:MAG: SlyX protein [Desulfovibrio sp. S3730MH75]|nr:MAG: SlyX protein [Desulfovibrio sp. S3730MH75]